MAIRIGTTPVDWRRDIENAPKGTGLLVVWNIEDATEPLFYWDAAFHSEQGEWLTFDGDFDKILGDPPIAWAYPPNRLPERRT